MNVASFDIEIYNDIEEGKNPLPQELIPSVAAYCTDIDIENVQYFYDTPYMTKETAKKLCNNLLEIDKDGYKIFGWNILSFDFPVLAFYADMVEEMGSLALRSIDPMFTLHAIKGHFLSLDSALVGANLETKLHEVTLRDGTTMFSMSGAKAPEMWRNGETKAVMDYLAYDVIQPYKLAGSIVQNGGIKWTSKTGKPSSVRMGLTDVKTCIFYPEVDQSWMTNPKKREEFYSWIPEEVLRKEGVV